MRRALGARPCARSLIAALIAGFALAASPSTAAASACPHADAAPGTAGPAEISAATLCLVNEERAAAGLRTLSTSSPLAQTASTYARDMVATQRFDHTDANGGAVTDRLQAVAGSLDPWLEVGENLGWGSLDQATPRAIVAGWMQSPSHRDNILHAPFDYLGVGVVEGAPEAGRTGALTYVAVFGDRRATTRTTKIPSRCSRARTRARARACRARAQRAARQRQRAAQQRATR